MRGRYLGKRLQEEAWDLGNSASKVGRANSEAGGQKDLMCFRLLDFMLVTNHCEVHNVRHKTDT